MAQRCTTPCPRQRKLTAPPATAPRPRPRHPIHQSRQPRCPPRRCGPSSTALKQDSRLTTQPLRRNVRRVCRHSPLLVVRPLRRTSRKQHPLFSRPDSRADWLEPTAAAVYISLFWVLARCQCLGLLPHQWRFVQPGGHVWNVPYRCVAMD